MRKQITKTQDPCLHENEKPDQKNDAQNIILIINQASQAEDCKQDSKNQKCIHQIQQELQQMYKAQDDQKQQQILQDLSNTIRQYVEIAQQQYEQLSRKIDKGIEEQNQKKDVNITLHIQKDNNQNDDKQQVPKSISDISQNLDKFTQNNSQQVSQNSGNGQVSGHNEQKQAFLVMPVDSQQVVSQINDQTPESKEDEEMDEQQKKKLLNEKMANTFNKILKNKKRQRKLMEDAEFEKRQKKFNSERKLLEHYQEILKDLDDKDEQLFDSQDKQQNFQRAVKIQDCIDKIAKIKGKIQERQLRLKQSAKSIKKIKRRKLTIQDEYTEEKMKSLILDRLEFIFNDKSKNFSSSLAMTTKEEQYYLFNLFQQYELKNQKIVFVSDQQKEFFVRAQQKIQSQHNRLKTEVDYPENLKTIVKIMQKTNNERKYPIFSQIEVAVLLSEEDKDLTQKALKNFYQEMGGKEQKQEEIDEDQIDEDLILKNKDDKYLKAQEDDEEISNVTIKGVPLILVSILVFLNIFVQITY